jgi:hypothetical protein
LRRFGTFARLVNGGERGSFLRLREEKNKYTLIL